MPLQGQPPSSSQKSSDQDQILQSLVQAIRHTQRGTRNHRTPPVASRETDPKMSNSKIPHHLLTVKFRQPSREFTFGVGMSFIPYPSIGTNPCGITSSRVHVGFGV
jgi:hypothetical protein